MRHAKIKKARFFSDKLIFIGVLSLFLFFNPSLVLMLTYVLLFPYLYITKRSSAYSHLLIATIFAVVWVIIANDFYGYNQTMIKIFGLNAFPLFAWSSGLLFSYTLYAFISHKYSIRTFQTKFLIFVLIYIPGLIVVETIGYHVLGIQNLATAHYVALPICHCIHAPLWMQMSYFLIGPLYFITCKMFGLENPHKQMK